MNKKLIPGIVGLALLVLLISTAQVSRISPVIACFSGLSLAIFVWVYYLLNYQIAELCQTESVSQDLYNNAPCGYYSLDPDGNFIAINDTALRWLGYSRDEMIGKVKITDLLTDREVVAFQENFCRIQSQNWLKDVAVQMIRKDGTILPALLSATAIWDAQGNLVKTRTTFFDITQRQEAEVVLRQQHEELEIRVIERTAELIETINYLQRELFKRERVERALRQSEERWQLAIRGSNDGIWDWNIKTDEVFFSTRWKEMLGYKDDEIGNRSGEWRKRIHPDDLERVLQCYQDHITKKIPFYAVEHRLLCKDGTYKWILTRGQALWDEEGNAIRLTGFHTDISDAYQQAEQRKLAEEALSQSEERFRSAFDYAAIGMSLIATDGKFLKVNKSVCEILGYSQPELRCKSFQELTYPEDLDLNLQYLGQILAGEIRSFQMEKRYFHKLGHTVWAHLSVSLVRDAQNQPLYFITQIQDITVRKQAEAERAKLIAILEATPDVVGTVSVDEQIRYLNSSARKIFRIGEHEDCTNFSICDIQPNWAYELVRKQGIPVAMRDGVWVGETAFLSHDGREIPVSQLIIAHKSPDGNVNMFSTIARNITQQKQIAATLFESERRWRSLLENVRLVVVGLDNSGKVEYANPYFLELVGYTQAEVIGQDWFETFLPLHQKKLVQNNFLELLAHKLYLHTQTVILTKSGEERVIAWNNTQLQDTEGYIIGTLSIGEDITERQVIERMKDEFISVVSHELRTPLTSIHGALNLLSSGLVQTQSDKGRRVIEIAATSAERLVRLVNDILELERLESGKISLSKQTCNAAELMQQAIDMIQVMANRAGITLCFTPQPIQFNADPDRIIQVLTNLLGNAIKFSSRGSTVWLTIEQRNNEKDQFLISNSEFSHVLFKIQDQGRGIPEDKVESIFERFHQVDTSDSRQKGGTGLGLAICRSIVQQHGGRIWVESTLGKGSSFYFTLPGYGE